MVKISNNVLFILSILTPAYSFLSPHGTVVRQRGTGNSGAVRFAAAPDSDHHAEEGDYSNEKGANTDANMRNNLQQQQQQQQQQQKRRDFLFTATAGVTIFPFMDSAFAEEDDVVTSAPLGPICVIGSNGKTGSECVGACIARGINVRATSRGGVYNGIYEDKDLLSNAVCDVTIPSTITSAIEGSRAVIFAASASKAGGTPAVVDNVGLVSVAKACIDQKIPQLVIVSSGAVTKPNSPVYKFLNLFGNIMEEKIKGEDTVRAMYKDINGSSSSCTYTVIRPGGLTEEEGKGVAALELNQGDSKSGRIARADVAALCIEATMYPNTTGGTTFECYDGETGKPLATVGLSNIMKAKNKSSDEVFVSGKERRGDTWEQIFTGLERDA